VSPTFQSLRFAGFRLWSVGALVSNIGTWMQRIAQDWLVLTELTDNSGVAIGVVTALQFAPSVFLAPIAGGIADRFDRRRVLIATQTLSGILSGVLGLLVLTDQARLWHVYVLACALGMVSAIDTPARQTFVAQLVPHEHLPNAVGLNSASFHSGRLIGPGLAGVLIQWLGTGPVFLINALSFVAVVVSLLRLGPADLLPQQREQHARKRFAALRHLRERPDMATTMLIVGVAGTFSLNFQLTTALMARLEFGRGAGEYGLLGSIMAVGSLTGALLGARRTNPQPVLVARTVLLFGGLAGLAALAPDYSLFALCLIPVGMAALTFMTASNAVLQMGTAPWLRGRVMALYSAIFFGGSALGSPLLGWIAQEYGARWSIGTGALAAIGVGVLGLILLHRQGGGRPPGPSQDEPVPADVHTS
jgi:MFS family permease